MPRRFLIYPPFPLIGLLLGYSVWFATAFHPPLLYLFDVAPAAHPAVPSPYTSPSSPDMSCVCTPLTLDAIDPQSGPFNRSILITLHGHGFLTDAHSPLRIVFAGLAIPEANLRVVGQTSLEFWTPFFPAHASSSPRPGSRVTVQVLPAPSPPCRDHVQQTQTIDFYLTEPVDVALTLLKSSYNNNTGRYTIPQTCGPKETPVLVASALFPAYPGSDPVPYFVFKYRYENQPDCASGTACGFTVANQSVPFSLLGANSSRNSVALDVLGMFSATALESEFVRVLVSVLYGQGKGEAQLLISRKLQPSTLAISIFPPRPVASLFQGSNVVDCPTQKTYTVESAFSFSQHCKSLPNSLKVQPVWTVNGNQVDPISSSAIPVQPSKPLLLGFGGSLLIPRPKSYEDSFESYTLSAVLLDTETNTVVATGHAAPGRLHFPSQRPVAVISSAESAIAVPVGTEFHLVGAVAKETDEGPALKSFKWSCRVASSLQWTKLNDLSGLNSSSDFRACSAHLLPPESSGLSSFTITLDGLDAGNIVEYVLTVSVGNTQSLPAMLFVIAASQDDNSLLPLQAGAVFYTSSGRKVIPANPCWNNVETSEKLILVPSSTTFGKVGNDSSPEVSKSPSQSAQTAVVYGLFNERATDYDLLQNDDLLLSGTSYWSNVRKNGVVLGIRSGALSPGKYFLIAGTGSTHRQLNASMTQGSIWMFRIASSARLVASSLPITVGYARETLFYASAAASPSENYSFYFALRSNATVNPLGTPIGSKACLGGCTGSPIVSFQVLKEGRYHIQIDLVAKNSVVIASVYADTPIVVYPRSLARFNDSDDIMKQVETATRVGNEASFLSYAEDFGGSLPATFADSVPFQMQLVENLSKLANSSIMSPLRASKMVDVATSLLNLPVLRRHDCMVNLLAVNRAAVLQISQPTGGPALVSSLVRFYSKAYQLSWNVLSAPSSVAVGATFSVVQRQVQAANDTLATGANFELDSTFSKYLTLGISRGRECGYSDQVTVELPLTKSSALLHAQTVCLAGQLDSQVWFCSNVVNELHLAPEEVLHVGIVQKQNGNVPYGKKFGTSTLLRSVFSAETALYIQDVASGTTVISPAANVSCLNVTFLFHANAIEFEKSVGTMSLSLNVSCPDAIQVASTEWGPDGVANWSQADANRTFAPTGDVGLLHLMPNGSVSVRVPIPPFNEVVSFMNWSQVQTCAGPHVYGPPAIPIIVTVLVMSIPALLLVCTSLVLYYFYVQRMRARQQTFAAPPLAKRVKDRPSLLPKLYQAEDPGDSSRTTERSWGETQVPQMRGIQIFLDPESDEENVDSCELEFGGEIHPVVRIPTPRRSARGEPGSFGKMTHIDGNATRYRDTNADQDL